MFPFAQDILNWPRSQFSGMTGLTVEQFPTSAFSLSIAITPLLDRLVEEQVHGSDLIRFLVVPGSP